MPLNTDRHFDSQLDAYVARISVGDCYVTNKDEVISTVLGSCIAACIRDPLAGIGGMNHFMLPGCGAARAGGDELAERRYGAASMEVLINALLAQGGRKERFEIKLFGGAELLAGGSSRIGQANTRFAHEFIRLEGLNLAAADCGGPYPRRVQYWPATGRAMVMNMPLERAQTELANEQKVAKTLAQKMPEGDIELFD
ncbi:MAG: chemoreceptor glutamine deamidase CheD [Gammaproteobacteria bacterium]